MIFFLKIHFIDEKTSKILVLKLMVPVAPGGGIHTFGGAITH